MYFMWKCSCYISYQSKINFIYVSYLYISESNAIFDECLNNCYSRRSSLVCVNGTHPRMLEYWNDLTNNKRVPFIRCRNNRGVPGWQVGHNTRGNLVCGCEHAGHPIHLDAPTTYYPQFSSSQGTRILYLTYNFS